MLKVKKEIRREYFEGKTMSWEVVKEMEDKANETGDYEVKLSNGWEIKFDMQFNVIDIDN